MLFLASILFSWNWGEGKCVLTNGMNHCQASQHEEQTKQLQHEKQALQKEFEAKLKSIEAENAARQADFEARLQSALQRSEVWTAVSNCMR